MNLLSKKGESIDMTVSDWDSPDETFLVCVYNVSPDQDYTFLQVPIGSTSQDIVTQVGALFKNHHIPDPSTNV